MRILPPLCGLITALALLAPTTALPQEASPRAIPPERIQVTRVLIDLVVRDRKDLPVRGLTPDDFLFEIDGEEVDPSDVRSFEEICAVEPSTPPAAAPGPSAAADEAAPAPGGPESEPPPRHLALYFDFSQLSMAGRIRALQGALEFFASPIPEGERVMLMTSLDGGLEITQEWTGDAKAIHRHLQRLLDDKSTVDLDVVDERAQVEDLADIPAESPADERDKLALAQRLADQEWERAQGSLYSLRLAIEELAPVRGRKALLYFGDLLRRDPGCQFIAAARGRIGALGPDLGGPLKQLTGLANAANVTFYTADLEGLRLSTPLTIAARGGIFDSQLSRLEDGDRMAPADASADELRQRLTGDTGGRYLRGTGDMATIVDGARGDLACYYLAAIRWDGKGDGASHEITVRFQKEKGVSRRGQGILHRPYFVDGPGS